MAHDPARRDNPSTVPPLLSLLGERLGRRAMLRGGVSTCAAALLPSLAACGDDDPPPLTETLPLTPAELGFEPVPHSTEDRVLLPAGYQARVLYAMGDPIAAGISEYGNRGEEADFDQRAGDQHDGMAYFGLADDGTRAPNRSDRGLLVMNHEQILDQYLHATGPTAADDEARPQAEVDKEMSAHGVSVIEVVDDGSGFRYVPDSSLNRRITATTPMEITGPARGSSLLLTAFSPGEMARGTLNNCANGHTPWGTYLTCEENWFGYFRRDDDAERRSESENALLARYGMGPDTRGSSYRGWDSVPGDGYRRFDVTATGDSAADDHRNEPNSFGYVVELDPFDRGSTPKKRSALGRFGHEGAWFGPVRPGQPVVVYMGDDSRFEYIYKFVSRQPWDPADENSGPAAGDKYLGDGTLYVARFEVDGRGTWLELSYGINGLDENNATYPFSDQAAVVVATRLAADSVGATPMDRPEWGAVHPQTSDVYFTLTNNSRRTEVGATDAPNPRNYAAPGEEELGGNINGHILRFRESDGASSTSFTWDVFLFGAPSDAPGAVNVSELSEENDFSSPDGLWFDRRGMLWIQTDDGAFPDAGRCNNQMLAAVPGQVGDGETTTIGEQATIVGRPASPSNLRRFLVGPAGCEITGVDMTPDYRTLFVNIQHPGEDGDLESFQSTWPSASRDATIPGEAGSRPRSATIVITRTDGGQIGVP